METKDHTNRIVHLIYNYILGNISETENAELQAWIAESESNRQTFERVTNLRNVEKELIRRNVISHKRPLQEMKSRIARAAAKEEKASNMRWYALAASVVVLLCATFWVSLKPQLLFPTDKQEAPQIASISDITHGNTKAKLTLEDGSVVELGEDTKANAAAMQKALEVSGTEEGKSKMLNLSIPRGGEFVVKLEDGTEVMLNAESSLVYPEHFNAEERRVQIIGEAYFKVAKNPDKPFYVESNGQLIRVTGTEFNVNSYNEESNVYTTLVSGSVAIRPLSGEGGELMLTPGHQAVFDKTKHSAKVHSVDTSVVSSWTKGSFVFEDQTLAQIMVDLSRWYDFDYKFMNTNAANTVFMGTVPRYGNFRDVLTILEKSGNLKFRLRNGILEIR